eukprot:1485_1
MAQRRISNRISTMDKSTWTRRQQHRIPIQEHHARHLEPPRRENRPRFNKLQRKHMDWMAIMPNSEKNTWTHSRSSRDISTAPTGMGHDVTMGRIRKPIRERSSILAQTNNTKKFNTQFTTQDRALLTRGLYHQNTSAELIYHPEIIIIITQKET